VRRKLEVFERFLEIPPQGYFWTSAFLLELYGDVVMEIGDRRFGSRHVLCRDSCESRG
jgi:hypothetical protein